MSKRPINRWWTRSIVGHQHHLLEVQLLNHGVEVPHLICCGIGIASRFIRFSPSEKIKGHNQAGGDQPGKETIVEMPLIWNAKHQDDVWLLPWILTPID